MPRSCSTIGRTMVIVEMKQDLGVGLAGESASGRFEHAAQLSEVVDFALERDDEPTVAEDHRLRFARRRIDDRQAPVRQPDAVLGVDPYAQVVRPRRGPCGPGCARGRPHRPALPPPVSVMAGDAATVTPAPGRQAANGLPLPACRPRGHRWCGRCSG